MRPLTIAELRAAGLWRSRLSYPGQQLRYAEAVRLAGATPDEATFYALTGNLPIDWYDRQGSKERGANGR